jgi:putrescine transport system substrate-binding protein
MAEKLIAAVRPHIRYFNSIKPIDDLATGEICLALMYSGDAGIAAYAASEAGNGIELLYGIPDEGTVIWIDSMVITSDASNIDGAHKFIDYILQPKVIADVSNTIFYSNANSASTEFVDPEIVGDPNIYPPSSVREKLFADIALPNKSLRLRTRAWTKIKTGR